MRVHCAVCTFNRIADVCSFYYYCGWILESVVAVFFSLSFSSILHKLCGSSLVFKLTCQENCRTIVRCCYRDELRKFLSYIMQNNMQMNFLSKVYSFSSIVTSCHCIPKFIRYISGHSWLRNAMVTGDFANYFSNLCTQLDEFETVFFAAARLRSTITPI